MREMHAFVTLSVIFSLIFGAQATFGELLAGIFDGLSNHGSGDSSTGHGNRSKLENLTENLAEIARDLAEDLAEELAPYIPEGLAEDLLEDIGAWESSPEWKNISEEVVEWNTTVWNSSVWDDITRHMANLNRTLWNNSEMKNVFERITEWNRSTWGNAKLDIIASRITDWENSADWSRIAERMVEWNRTVWNNSMWQHITECVAQWNNDTWSMSEWQCVADHLAWWNTTMWNSSELESIAEHIAEWVDGMHNHSKGGHDGRLESMAPLEGGHDGMLESMVENITESEDGMRNHGEGGHVGELPEEPGEESELVSGTMALIVSDATAFAANQEAKHVVRAALAELVSIEEEHVAVLSMTAGAAGGSRRLTGARETGEVTVRYVIIGSGRSHRIAADLRRSSQNEVTRLFNAQLQSANLPFAVSAARVIVASVAFLSGEERDETGNSDMQSSSGNRIFILLGVISLLSVTLCLGVAACVYRSMMTPRGPKVIVVEGVRGPANDAVVNSAQYDNKTNEKGVVIGHVVPDSMEGSGYYV